MIELAIYFIFEQKINNLLPFIPDWIMKEMNEDDIIFAYNKADEEYDCWIAKHRRNKK